MNIRDTWGSLEPNRRYVFLAGLLAIVVVAAGLLWWTFRSNEQLLFGNLRERDAAEITQALTEWKVPYTITDGGSAIRVSADKVYDTRMKLVAAGIPKGGHAGFELFDHSDFGVTEFAQRVNYQRALQGEIERTIASMPGVQDARVHLTIRRPGMFSTDQESSKASVALNIAPGITLSQSQIEGIRSLVSASVEGLSPAHVSVLDSNGALLAAATAASDADGGIAISDETSRVEASIQAKVEHLLTQFLRKDQFRVSVDVTLNAEKFHEVSERPISTGGTGNDLMSRQQSTSGYTSNGSKRQEDTQAEFIHGTTRTEVSRAGGQIERMSIAVAIPPNAEGVDPQSLQDLISAAAGINPQRGDRLQISSLGWRAGSIAPGQTPTISGVEPGEAGHVVARMGWWQWALGGGLLLMAVVMAILMLLRRPRTPRLSPTERDAVLEKLKGWLAEGEPNA
ncbi:flagellar basal-body MS-ring/collar protein FliF [Solilutibacter silvestris]|uniref:flagellar basal-body MS-ring/collar protein FliF n=1 Tax=Solilutibacter silvestris TaxID=1645665 RepID=UPI003D347E7C